MPKYQVNGELLKLYKINIEADSAIDAYFAAEQAATHEWQEIETDNSITVVDADELELI
jgi:hypothetical protein